MPTCGSQIVLCDLPIRFDTYQGCSHACQYCFVKKKYDISNIKRGEGPKALAEFIAGRRVKETYWCDWDIPIHWGGVSDPFQPAEAKHRLSYKALEIFAKTKYPFVVSTKGRFIEKDEYLDLLKQCNCVVQISLVSPKFDAIEKGAPTFNERLEIIRKISPYVKRVIIRVQPYVLEVINDVLQQIPAYAEAGVYGLTIEGMKYKHRVAGLVKVNSDYCYPVETLRKHFDVIKATCHKHGLRFYAAENRLRKMGDSLCCCGVDGLEKFIVNTYNVNHYLYDRGNFVPKERMQEVGSATCFKTFLQTSSGYKSFSTESFAYFMQAASKDENCLLQLIDK